MEVSNYDNADDVDSKIEKINKLEELFYDTYSKYQSKFNEEEIDDISLGDFVSYDSQSKINKYELKNVINKLCDLTNTDPKSIMESDDPNSAIDDLCDKLNNIDQDDELENILNDLYELNNINYTETMNNDEGKAPINSEIVQKLYNSIATKYDIEVDDVELSENNLKILEISNGSNNTNENDKELSFTDNSRFSCCKMISTSKSKRDLVRCPKCHEQNNNDRYKLDNLNNILNKLENDYVNAIENNDSVLVNILTTIKKLTGDKNIIPNRKADMNSPTFFYADSSDFEEAIDSIMNSLDSFALNPNSLNDEKILSNIEAIMNKINDYITNEDGNYLNGKNNNLYKTKLMSLLKNRYNLINHKLLASNLVDDKFKEKNTIFNKYSIYC